MNKKNIYIVLTQTGTVLSRVLKTVTGAEYNHVSIALDETLTDMYSFGRINAYIPFWGGFVKESTEYGTFKRFKNTDAIILGVEVSLTQYQKTSEYIKNFWAHKRVLHYNYKGLFLAAFGKKYQSERKYYCSEFVKEVLIKTNVVLPVDFPEIVHPIYFLELFTNNVIFKGKLRNFTLREI